MGENEESVEEESTKLAMALAPGWGVRGVFFVNVFALSLLFSNSECHLSNKKLITNNSTQQHKSKVIIHSLCATTLAKE